MKFDLQYFAEPDDKEDGTDQENEPQVPVAEMKRRLAKEQEKYQTQINEIKNGQEQAIKEAIEKAQHEANLSGKELQEYKEKEAERKHQADIEERDKQIAELTKAQRQREIRDESITKLNELQVPVNEHSLSLVGADTLEDMSAKADALSVLLSAQRKENAQSNPPLASGGLSNGKGVYTAPQDIFRNANILNKK